MFRDLRIDMLNLQAYHVDKLGDSCYNSGVCCILSLTFSYLKAY